MSIIITAVVLVMGIWYVSIALAAHSYERRWLKGFQLDIHFSSEQAAEGEVIYLYETVTNEKDMILPAVCIKFKTSRHLKFLDTDSGSVSDYFYRNDVLSVQGYEKVRRKLQVRCMRRGEYSVEEAEIVGNDYFLRRCFVEKRKFDSRLVVYPSLINVERMMPIFKKSFGELSTQVPLFEDPFEYVGVRDYQPGDTMNRIHWKASARTGKWQVRTSAYTASQPSRILLNLESPGSFTNENAMEENIRIACSLAYYLDTRGIPVSFTANGSEMLRMKNQGKNNIPQLRWKLATISYAELCCSGAQLLQREQEHIYQDEHVFFVSSCAKQQIQEQVTDILHRGISLTWIIVISGGEDDSRGLSPALENIVVRWKI